MTIAFERRTDRPDATGRCTIHLRAYFDNQRLRFATRERCLGSLQPLVGVVRPVTFAGFALAKVGLKVPR